MTEQITRKIVTGTDGKINFRDACAISGYTEVHFRKLVKRGMPKEVAAKNEKGFWRFDEKALRQWLDNRPTRAGGATDGKATYKCRLLPAEAEALAKSMPQINLRPAYRPKKAEAKAEPKK